MVKASSSKPVISEREPDGPLRGGLVAVGNAIGDENGGQVFRDARDVAQEGMHAVLALHHVHNLGDPNISIPPARKAVQIQRERGAFPDNYTSAESPAEASIAPRM